MAAVEMIFAGFGGQGVLSMGLAVAYAAMFEGKHVAWLPAYGPEQRGGTANCMVVVSDDEVGSPLVTDPDVAVVMNGPSLEKFGPHVKPGGMLFINSSLIAEDAGRDDVRVIRVPTLEPAEALGEGRVANMVMLGAVIEASGVVGLAAAEAALEKVLPARRRHLIEVNRAALAKGAELAAGAVR